MIRLHPQVKALWEREGIEPLRYDYELDTTSLVLDVGGSIGNFAREIIRRFHCNVEIYEPMQVCYDSCAIKFSGDKKVKVIHAAVGDKKETIFIDTFKEAVVGKQQTEEGSYELAEAIDVADITGRHIDLMKLNIEGSEYPVLERLVKTNIKNVDNIQVQFHMTDGDSFLRRYKIQQYLAATHELAWCYEFVWESWRRKK